MKRSASPISGVFPFTLYHSTADQIEFVVARYNENIEWTSSLPGKVTIYNKGGDGLEKSIPLPNIGRESATYLHHIVSNYDALMTLTVFTQANIRDHASGFLEQLSFFQEQKFAFLTDKIFECDWDGLPHHGGLPIEEVWNDLLLGDIRPRKLTFGPGAIMLVAASAIRKRPKAFYVRALEMHTVNSSMPWVLERLWGCIFSNDAQG